MALGGNADAVKPVHCRGFRKSRKPANHFRAQYCFSACLLPGCAGRFAALVKGGSLQNQPEMIGKLNHVGVTAFDPLQALATVGFGAIKSQTFPKTSIGGSAPPKAQPLAAQ
jgi:hypothetical protein